MQSHSINIINVPSDVGSVYAGKSRAPAAFSTAGLQKKLEDVGWRVTESTALAESSAGSTSSTREPNGARNEDATPSCQPTGVHLEGTGKRIGILYIDADCDLYTPLESNTIGNIAGMTLTHLTLREGALNSMKSFSRPDGRGVVDSNNIALFGLNIESPANKREHLGYLFDNGFQVTTSQAVQKDPLQEATTALGWMEDRIDYIFVHLDVDVIDPGLFPLGNVPNYTGLSFEAAMAAFKTFLRSDKLVGLSVAEVNPDHDPELKMTKQLIEEVVSGLGGAKER